MEAFADQLKSAREARGLRRVDVARATKIYAHHIAALEHAHFGDLPDASTVETYVRTYAEYLGLEPDPLVDACRRAFAGDRTSAGDGPERMEVAAVAAPGSTTSPPRPREARPETTASSATATGDDRPAEEADPGPRASAGEADAAAEELPVEVESVARRRDGPSPRRPPTGDPGSMGSPGDGERTREINLFYPILATVAVIVVLSGWLWFRGGSGERPRTPPAVASTDAKGSTPSGVESAVDPDHAGGPPVRSDPVGPAAAPGDAAGPEASRTPESTGNAVDPDQAIAGSTGESTRTAAAVVGAAPDARRGTDSPKPAETRRDAGRESDLVAPGPAVGDDTAPSSPTRDVRADASPRDPAATSRGELSVAEHGVGTGVVDHRLVGESDRFEEGSGVWFWTRVVGGSPGRTIDHIWLREGVEIDRVRLKIGAATWRTQSRKSLWPGQAGRWTVEARDEDGRVLARRRFTAVPRRP